jgi:hypothetical protein
MGVNISIFFLDTDFIWIEFMASPFYLGYAQREASSARSLPMPSSTAP